MKRSLLIIAIAFTITVAAIFGVRASADALAVVLGVILGVVASVPTTFMVTYLLTRPRSNNDAASPQLPHQPPVVIINASDKATMPPQPVLPALTSPGHSRRWTVIGDSDTDD
jgi:hypothetical protein